MAAIRFILLFSYLFFYAPNKHKRYVIVAGDISCKACVVQLHQYLSKKAKKDKLVVAFRDKGNLILNEAGPAYFKKELPKAQFVFINDASFFPLKEKFPYLLSICEKDTLRLPYDSLFVGDGLNVKHLQ